MALESRRVRTGRSYAARIWRLVAFLGRYCHQPVNVSLSLPVDDLQRLADATGALLEAETKG